MTDTSTDAPIGITLLGSEMLTWSDFQGATGAVRGRIAGLLLHGFDGSRRRALVAGPHDSAVVAEVAAQFDRTDVLVRSLDDARQLRSEQPDTVHVFCGPLDRFAPPQRYDAVIALDGLDRLHSAEEEQPAWSATLEGLAGLLGEGAELYLGIGNEAGVDRLLALDPDQRHDDANWPNGRATTGGVPLDLDELTAQLVATHGLAMAETWACYGPRAEPLLAAPADFYSRHRHDPRLGVLVERAAGRAAGDLVPVKDPGRTARTLLRHGLGAELAPLWVLHLRAGSAVAAGSPAGLVLLAEPEVSPGRPGLAMLVRTSADEWTRELIDAGSGPGDVASSVLRDPALLAAPIPRGELVGVLLSDLCTAQDMSGVGALVRRYRDWLGQDAPLAVASAAKVPVTFGGLVDTGSALVPLDPSYRATVSAPVDDVFVRTLLVAARAVLASGLRHPWPVSSDPLLVTRSLAAAAGLELDADGYARAVDLDLVLSPRGEGDVESPISYAEAVGLLAQYRQRATETEAQIDWLLVNIHQRQRANKFLGGRLEMLRTSAEFRTGLRVLWFRTLYRKARKRVRAKLGKQDRRAAGEWVPPVAGKEREPIEVDPELLPPGYEPKSDVI